MLGMQDSDRLDLDSFFAEGSSAVQNLLEFFQNHQRHFSP